MNTRKGVKLLKTKPRLKCKCDWVEYNGKFVRIWSKDCRVHFNW